MGQKDAAARDYLEMNKYFADLINYSVYHGEQVVSPDELTEANISEFLLPYGNNASAPEQKYRDLIKVFRKGKRAVYSLYGIEVQSHVHFAAPVKSMVYDVLNLARQVQNAANSYRNQGKDASITVEGDKVIIKLSSDEFLSGFRKEDKLVPVVTVFVFLSGGRWDGPRSISDMYQESDPDTLAAAIDGKLNLVVPAEMPDEDFQKFHTDIGAVLKYFKKGGNDGEHRFPIEFIGKNLDLPTGQFLHNYCGISVEEVVEEGGTKMCRMLADYANDRMILGAYEAYLDCMTEEDAVKKTCEKYSITPEQLKSMIKQWAELVASGRVDLTLSNTYSWTVTA